MKNCQKKHDLSFSYTQLTFSMTNDLIERSTFEEVGWLDGRLDL